MEEMRLHTEKLAKLQESRENLEDEYEDLYDSHQMLMVALQDAEQRQDGDAKVISVRSKRCIELEEENTRHMKRIEELEVMLAGGGDAPACPGLRSASASVHWWKEKCRAMRADNHILQSRLDLLSDEACPMMCERPFALRMQCCGSNICAICFDLWAKEKSSCPFCRASPSVAHRVDRIGARAGSASKPIVVA